MSKDETPPTPAQKPVCATVCHRVLTVDSVWVPQAEYQGQTLYFCTEACLEAFCADPERFFLAHSHRKDLRE